MTDLKDQQETSATFYSKGNEAFVSDNYKQAVELYSRALELDPAYTDCLVARAHGHIKCDNYELGKQDAAKAIDLLRAVDPSNPSLAKAFLRSGVASFHLGLFKEAKNSFTEGRKLGEESGLLQWMDWCDQKIKKFGDTAPGAKKEQSVTAKEPVNESAKEPVKESAKEPISESAKKPVKESAKEDDSQAMPVPKVSHDWYQTEGQVVVEVRLKKLNPDECKVEFGETSLSVSAPLSTGSEYSLMLDLAHPVLPLQSSYKVLSTKMEIKLKKAVGERWHSLEGDGLPPLPGGGPAPTSTGKQPYSSGKDWSAMEKSLSAEAEEKKEGEAALNEMFQKIYGDANDDVKKAMNKSFQESGGTVLSTNWTDIGKEKTDIKPPDGMEHKKWD